jgi:hypothetical protein
MLPFCVSLLNFEPVMYNGLLQCKLGQGSGPRTLKIFHPHICVSLRILLQPSNT